MYKHRVVIFFLHRQKNFHVQRRRTKSRHFIISAEVSGRCRKKLSGHLSSYFMTYPCSAVQVQSGAACKKCPPLKKTPLPGRADERLFRNNGRRRSGYHPPAPMPCLPATIVPPSLRGNFCGRWSHRRQRRTLLFSREDIRRTQKLRFLPLIDVSGSRAAARRPRLLFPLPEKNAKKQRDTKTDVSCHAACCIDGILPAALPRKPKTRYLPVQRPADNRSSDPGRDPQECPCG